jgi:hypothetical protein
MTHDPMRTRPKSQKNTTGGSLRNRERRCRMHGGAHQALADPRAHATATTSMAGTPLR